MKYSRSYLLDKPKTARKRRRLLFMLIFLLMVLAVVCAINVISTFNSFHNDEEWAQELRLQGSGNERIYLVYGLDFWGARPYVERLLLLHHDTISGKLNLVYIPGNTMYETPSGGAVPLGQLYRRDSKHTFLKQVQDLLNLPVHHYVELNYKLITVMNDYFGGIRVEELQGIPGEDSLLPGKERLDGFELYRLFLTMDHWETPEEQLERQRLIALALWRRLDGILFFKWPGLVRTAAPYLETDLSWREIKALREQFEEYSFDAVNVFQLPGSTEIRDGSLYWVVDKEVIKDVVAMLNEGYLVVPEEVKVEVLNGSGIQGAAARLAQQLEEEGFVVTYTGNADHFEFEKSQVIALDESVDKARAVALHIPGAIMLQRPEPEGQAHVRVIIGENYAEFINQE